MVQATGLMQGKRGVILGVANNRSIAWGIAKACREQGAEIALTYQGDALKKRVAPSRSRTRISSTAVTLKPPPTISARPC